MTVPTRARLGRPRSWAKVATRFAISAVLLFLIGQALDVADVLARLSTLDARWIGAALVLSLLQMLLLAWRWRFTAGRLGIDLPFGEAVSEYYLGVFLNQLLPGGVSGDVSRAWRHARTPAPTGPAVRAVILERLTAQVVMTTVALFSVLYLLGWSVLQQAAAAGAAIGLAMVVVRRLVRRAEPGSWRARIWADTRAAVLVRDALPFQFVTSLVATSSYVALFLMAARAIGVPTGTAMLVPLVAPVLMTMLIPITVAGWGVREGAAAALWGLVGLTPEDGVAVSIAYGLLVLVSSAPGALVLTTLLPGGRDRRVRHDPE